MNKELHRDDTSCVYFTNVEITIIFISVKMANLVHKSFKFILIFEHTNGGPVGAIKG